MSATILLFPLPGEPGAFSWVRQAARGRPAEHGRATAESPLVAAAGDRVVMVAPGEEVTLHAVEPPTRSETQALAAARFAIEDDLAAPLEEVHVQLAARRGRGEGRLREAIVVDAELLAAWRTGLESVGAAVDHITPDYALLTPPPDGALVIELGDRVLARGPGLGLAIDAALAPTALAAALARLPGVSVRLLSDRPDTVLPAAAREGRAVETGPPPTEAELLALYAEAAGDPAIDLSRSWRVRKPAGASMGPLDLRRWRVAASLAVAAGVGFLALLGAETLALRGAAKAAEAETERLMRAAFPDIGRLTNTRAQLRERLGASGAGGASFLELSAMLSEAVAGIETLEVQSLRFDAAAGGLEAAVVYASYADMERLQAGIAAQGGRLVQGASRTQGGRMTGDVTVMRP